jgi:predicted RNA-binding Zn ribbon-like protein
MLDPESLKGAYEIESGVACLDFANTLSWRLCEKSHEWLKNYENLLEWAILAGIIKEEETQDEEFQIRGSAGEIKQQLARAIRLREAIYRIFSAISGGRQTKEADLQIINQEVLQACKQLFIAQSGNRYAWQWVNGTALHDRILGTVARSAVDLLTSNDLERVGECQGDGCGWLFIDNSKNHTRRWCSMNDCGNRAKARKHYHVHKSQVIQK